MLKVLQVRTEENTSCRKKSSILVKSDRLKIVDMKILQNSISAQTLLKHFGFQVKHFYYIKENPNYVLRTFERL